MSHSGARRRSQRRRCRHKQCSSFAATTATAAAVWLTGELGCERALVKPPPAPTALSRRSASFWLPAASVAAGGSHSCSSAVEVAEPLSYCGGGFCTSFSVDGRRFRGVVDTGSPFVLVSTCREGPGTGPGGCQAYCRSWGCTSSTAGEPSGLDDTDEVYAAGSAHVAWRRGSLSFGGANLGKVTYGAMLEVESFGGNGGGAFLGLVRDKSERIRPTLLGQTRLRSLTVDLRAPGSELLRLTSQPLASRASAVPLLDLRSAGAPVRFYAAEISALSFAGERVPHEGRMVAVLDTGTTGLGLPPALFERYDATRRAKAAELGLRGAQSVEVELAANPPVVLRLQQGRLAAYGGSAFDIVTPIPEPPGMDADATALWAGASAGTEMLEVRGALAFPSQQPALAQADRPVSRGGRFRVRVQSTGELHDSSICDVAVGLAARGGSVGSAYAYASGSRARGVRQGTLAPGDTIECGLTEEGAIYWQVNGGPATAPEPLDTARTMFPTVEAGPGCSVELLEAPGWGSPRWAEAARPRSEERPLVLFLGLGFLLGRAMSVDTVANVATFDA